MKRIIVVVWFLFLAACGGVTAQDIYLLIQSGKLDDAREALQARSGQFHSDGSLLFYAALVQPDADSAAALLEAALANGAQDRFAQECYRRLAQISCLTKRYEQAIQWTLEYIGKYPKGAFWPDISRLQALALEQTSRPAQALDIIDQYVKRKLDRDVAQQGLLEKARLLADMGKPVGATTILSRLTKEGDGEAVPPALYTLAATSLRSGKAEDAGRYYALLFEEFPLAVGLGSLENQISSAPPTPTRSDQAERLTATYYSVKVGVFSSADNARAQAAAFGGRGSPIEIVQKTIQGKAYHIVYVGKFREYDAAARLRATLQQQTGEKYEVAAR